MNSENNLKMSWEIFVEVNNVPKMFAEINLLELNESLKHIARSWLKSKSHLVLYGSVGTGKTYFSYCLIKALLCKIHLSEMYFTTAKAMDDKLIKFYKDYGSSQYVIEELQKIPFLFIDDFGIDRTSEKMERDLYDILNSRWGNFKTTVISTNLTPETIEQIYGSRISSRLKDWEWIYFGNKDLRGNDKYKEQFISHNLF